MLKKLFTPPEKPATLPDAQVQRALAQLALAPPAFEWAALVSVDGLLLGLFPNDRHSQDRVAAMSAAMLSLGERIAKELSNGALEYTLIAGAQGKTLVVVLGREHILAVGLGRDVPLNEALATIEGEAGPLRGILHA